MHQNDALAFSLLNIHLHTIIRSIFGMRSNKDMPKRYGSRKQSGCETWRGRGSPPHLSRRNGRFGAMSVGAAEDAREEPVLQGLPIFCGEDKDEGTDLPAGRGGLPVDLQAVQGQKRGEMAALCEGQGP